MFNKLKCFVLSFSLLCSVAVISVNAKQPDINLDSSDSTAQPNLIEKPKRVRTVVPIIYTGPTTTWVVEYCQVNETSVLQYTTIEVLANGPEAYIYDTIYHYSNEFVYSDEPIALPE